MKIKVLAGLLVFLIVVNLVTIGSYIYFQLQRPPEPPGSRERPPGPRLELNREQFQQLRQLMGQFMKETRDQQEKIWDLQNEIFELLQQEPVPMTVIDQKLAEITATRLEVSKKATKDMIKAKEFLSPAQQKRFYNLLMQSRPGRRWERRPFRGGPRQPPFDHAPF